MAITGGFFLVQEARNAEPPNAVKAVADAVVLMNLRRESANGLFLLFTGCFCADNAL